MKDNRLHKIEKSTLILILGLFGIASVLVTIISDFILIGKASSAYDFLLLGTESMWDISAVRIAIGAFIGVVVLPFQLLGLVPVYFALKPAGKVLPVIMVIVNAHTLLMGVAFHISYAFIGSGWILHHQPDAAMITSDLMEQYDFYWMVLAVIMAVELIFCSVIYSIVIGRGKSLFPRWMAVFSPLTVVIVAVPLIFLLPYPVGGYLAPACLNISTLIFFLLTLTIGYQRIRQAEDRGES